MTQLPFQKLQIWSKALVLAKQIYEITRSFPADERFGLVDQMRRAAISIPSNIAEGSQRGSDKEFAHFLRIAKGSLAEIETQTILSFGLGYFSEEAFRSLKDRISELSKMLRSFIAIITTR